MEQSKKMKNKQLVINFFNHLVEGGMRQDVAARKTAKTYSIPVKKIRALLLIKPNKVTDQRNALIKYLHKEHKMGADEIGIIIGMAPVYIKRFLK